MLQEIKGESDIWSDVAFDLRYYTELYAAVYYFFAAMSFVCDFITAKKPLGI